VSDLKEFEAVEETKRTLTRAFIKIRPSVLNPTSGNL
jgi:hypothetical protein